MGTLHFKDFWCPMSKSSYDTFIGALIALALIIFYPRKVLFPLKWVVTSWWLLWNWSRRDESCYQGRNFLLFLFDTSFSDIFCQAQHNPAQLRWSLLSSSDHPPGESKQIYCNANLLQSKFTATQIYCNANLLQRRFTAMHIYCKANLLQRKYTAL